MGWLVDMTLLSNIISAHAQYECACAVRVRAQTALAPRLGQGQSFILFLQTESVSTCQLQTFTVLRLNCPRLLEIVRLMILFSLSLSLSLSVSPVDYVLLYAAIQKQSTKIVNLQRHPLLLSSFAPHPPSSSIIINNGHFIF